MTPIPNQPTKQQTSFLGQRTLVPASTLSGPRVYSTDLHATNFRPEYVDDFVATTARALKTKILTKGTVTVHMSHLLSPGGILFLEACPDCLQCKALLPAFREDKQSVEEYVTDHEKAYRAVGIDDSRIANIVSLLEGCFERVMPWQLGDVHAQYRDRMAAGLVDPRSMVRRHLLSANGNNSAQIDQIANEISAGDFSVDGSMRRFLNGTDPSIRSVLGYYEQAVYHMVGTNVVNCESGTDLSPASSFSALTVAKNDDSFEPLAISEAEIFLRFFLGEAFEAMQSGATPVTVLDAMPFEYVDRINQRFGDARFHERYDSVVTTAIEKLNLSSPYALEEFDGAAFAEMASTIHSEFICEIEKEVRDYDSLAYQEARADTIGQIQNIGLGIAGAAAELGSLLTLYTVGKGYGSFLSAAHKAGGLATYEGFRTLAPDLRKERMFALIEKAQLSEVSKTRLLDGAKLICDFNAAKVARL